MNLSAAYLKKRGEWREEALKEGRQEGRQEERRIVAENLLQQGVSVEIIATATGLSIEEIHQLQPGS
jgi:predicted transposase/invertase (TIGR01784 family)